MQSMGTSLNDTRDLPGGDYQWDTDSSSRRSRRRRRFSYSAVGESSYHQPPYPVSHISTTSSFFQSINVLFHHQNMFTISFRNLFFHWWCVSTGRLRTPDYKYTRKQQKIGGRIESPSQSWFYRRKRYYSTILSYPTQILHIMTIVAIMIMTQQSAKLSHVSAFTFHHNTQTSTSSIHKVMNGRVSMYHSPYRKCFRMSLASKSSRKKLLLYSTLQPTLLPSTHHYQRSRLSSLKMNWSCTNEPPHDSISSVICHPEEAGGHDEVDDIYNENTEKDDIPSSTQSRGGTSNVSTPKVVKNNSDTADNNKRSEDDNNPTNLPLTTTTNRRLEKKPNYHPNQGFLTNIRAKYALEQLEQTLHQHSYEHYFKTQHRHQHDSVTSSQHQFLWSSNDIQEIMMAIEMAVSKASPFRTTSSTSASSFSKSRQRSLPPASLSTMSSSATTKEPISSNRYFSTNKNTDDSADHENDEDEIWKDELRIDIAEFVTLLLSVEEYPTTNHLSEKSPLSPLKRPTALLSPSSSSSSTGQLQEQDDSYIEQDIHFNNHKGSGSNDESSSSTASFTTFMTKETLIAAIFHEYDCVVAKENGIDSMIQMIMRSPTTTSSSTPQSPFWLASKERNENTRTQQKYEREASTRSHDNGGTNNDNHHHHFMGVEEFGPEAIHIYKSAARIKQAEVMTHALSSSSLSESSTDSKANSSPADASILRGLLLTMTEDYRALAIRSTACLHRLRKIVQEEGSSSHVSPFSVPSYTNGKMYQRQSNSSTAPTSTAITNRPSHQHNSDDTDGSFAQRKQNIMIAREAFQVYAPLAQRMGMFRLKNELENTAFRFLYSRQYAAATSIYASNGYSTVESIASSLSSNVQELLLKDEWLSNQLSSLTVTSRVKQPYSLWKKLMKQRLKVLQQSKQEYAKKKSNEDLSVQNSKRNGKSISSIISHSNQQLLSQVQDAIALRVIIQSKNLIQSTSDDITMSNEDLLCYYIQNKLVNLWPASNERIKDYISMPKANGYQSLHHTARVDMYGQEWNFEVQIRTEDMHRRSEFGVAAHWEYKSSTSGSDSRVLQASDNLGVDRQDLSSLSFLDTAHEIDIENTKPNSLSLKSAETVTSLSHNTMIQSYIDALTDARDQLLENDVYVFISPSQEALDGKLIGMPLGSSITDALMELSKEKCYGGIEDDWDKDICSLEQDEIAYCDILLNGLKLYPDQFSDTLITNGDVLTIHRVQ